MMNKIIPISKKARKKLRLARYPALFISHENLQEYFLNSLSKSLFGELFE
jgi:hypothetical protein